MYYRLLPDHKVIPTDYSPDLWDMKKHDRRVAETTIGPYRVSTVFLVIDHGFGNKAPLLFETMVFGPESSDDDQWRYSTWDAAVEGHAKVCEFVKVRWLDAH